jgi:integrase
VCALPWRAVDLTQRVIHAERRKGRRGNAIAVTVPINGTLLAVLQALPSRLTSPWVFPNLDATEPLDGREYDRLVFRPALRRAKIRDFRFKDLRHTFATRLRMQGRADISSIATLLGHTSTRMSERYAHADNAHLHTLVGALDGPEIGVPSDTKSDTSAESDASAAS